MPVPVREGNLADVREVFLDAAHGEVRSRSRPRELDGAVHGLDDVIVCRGELCRRRATAVREVGDAERRNAIQQRQVEVGELVDGALRIVKSGIGADDRVIVGGEMRALPGNTVVPVTASANADKAGK